MYKRDFDRLQKDFKSYLFWGDEPYFVEKYATTIADRLCPKEQRLSLYFEEYDFRLAKEYLGQSSLFGDTNLLLLRHDKALPKKELGALLELCQKNPNSYLVYMLPNNEGKKIASLFNPKKDAVEVRFFKATLPEAKAELMEYAKKMELSIDSFAIEHLLALLEGDLLLAKKELEKLSTLQESIGPKEIDRLVFPLNPLNLERLYIAIIQKEPLSELFQKILEEEQNEMKILLGFQNFLRQLFLFSSYIRLHGQIDSKEILGYKLPPKIEAQRVQLAIKIKAYPQIFLELQECEYQLKTAQSIDKETLLFSCLIKIQGYL